MIEVPSDDARLQRTLYPSPNGELCYHIDSPPDPAESPLNCPHHPTPAKEITEAKILEKCRALYPDVDRIAGVLSRWIHHGREGEVDKPLINALLFLDHDLAISVLRQLRQPRAQLANVRSPHRIRKIDGNSVVIPLTLTTLTDSTAHAVDTLLDCGASGLGYLHHNWVTKNNIPTKALPYPIPVYNADGTLNKSGSITHTCELVVTIDDHVETLTFAVTNTGSSNAILGLSWLRFHNPLVDWRTGKICFTNCPSACCLAPPPPVNVTMDCSTSAVDHGPDGEHIRCFEEYPTPTHQPDDTDVIEQEWCDFLTSELQPDDESLLCVDLNKCDDGSTGNKTDPRVTHFLRQQREATTGPDRYVKDFSPVFTKSTFDELPPRRSWDHAIELKGDTKPLTSKVYPLSKSEQVALDDFVTEHLASGRIRPSKSPFAAPFFFVKKKDGALRPVQDYRRLNDMTIKNRYPLPLVSELMDKLKDSRYFTKIDIRWGFNNVRIKEGDEHKAAFITNRGLFEPLVMFFGLTNSPATFQAMMNDIFRDLISAGHVIVYMDDILIFTDDIATHRLITRQVLQILLDNNLSLKLEKCVFEVEEVEYLGVIIAHGTVRMDPKKVEAVASWPTPRNKKDVQQFLGFVNFYRRFVRNFARLATPLNRLCGSSPWVWSSTEQDAFLALRKAATEGPILSLPIDDAPFRVEADSSGYATGAVLSQLQDNYWRPVAYYSKSLNDVERNYDIHDRELLSIMRALADWRRYLHGSTTPFEIYSDHKNLQYFMTNQKLNRRQARWSLELAEFNFTLIHKPGSSMICADALSRRPDYDKGENDNDNITLLKPEHIRRVEVSYESSALVEGIKKHKMTLDDVWNKHRNLHGWTYSDGVLCWYNRIYVPQADSLRERILRENHDVLTAGHPGRSKTIELIQRNFWWPSLAKDVRTYVDGCPTCQRTKPLRQKPHGLLTPNEIPRGYWEIISCDFIVDLPRSRGFDSIMVCVDRLSKMVRLIPCNKTISSEGAARKYRDNVWKDFGLPSRIISDRGSTFVSNFTRALNALLGISENFSTARRPQTDGQTERANQEIEQYLRIFCNTRQSDWAEWLSCAEFALNNKVNASTGYSPFFLNYGRDPRRPLLPVRRPTTDVPKANEFAKQMDALTKETSAALQLAAEAMERSYDRSHQPAKAHAIGNLLLLDARGIETTRPSKKLDDKRLGPFPVTELIGLQDYRLRLPPSWKIGNTFHTSRLTRYTMPAFPSQIDPPRIPDLAEMPPIIDSIISHRHLRKKTLYLVLLQDQDPEDAKWLPLTTLTNYSDPHSVVDAYHREFPALLRGG
jgi:hypothetical protein